MKCEYSVYYQTGGTLNFKWQRTFETYTKEDAQAKVNEIEHQGYPAHYALTRLLDNIGLPDTFENLPIEYCYRFAGR